MTIINSEIPLPEAAKKRARRQAGNKNVKPNPAASLLAALKFVAVAQKKAGPIEAQFCKIVNGWVLVCDGIVTMGHPIEEDLEACPNTLQFIKALSKVKDELAITQLNQNTLSVCYDKLKALIPCVNSDEIDIPWPDEQCAEINDSIKSALRSVYGISIESSPKIEYAAVLLNANTAVATNGEVLIEAWHGINLPPNLMLPKRAAMIISKSKYALTGFGFSQSSATFYFDNGSFIKTQLYNEKFPGYLSLFDIDTSNLIDIPEDFYIAVNVIANFSPEGEVYFKDGFILSGQTGETSSWITSNLPDDMCFKIKNLLLIKNEFKKACFIQNENRAIFFGDRTRGIIMGMAIYKDEALPEPNCSNDVPF